MKTIAIYRDSRPSDVWDVSIIEAAKEEGLEIETLESPDAIRGLGLEKEDEKDFLREAEAVGYPAARISHDGGYDEYWIKAEGNWKQAAAAEFFTQSGDPLLIEVPDKAEAARLLQYRGNHAREIRALASKILRGEA